MQIVSLCHNTYVKCCFTSTETVGKNTCAFFCMFYMFGSNSFSFENTSTHKPFFLFLFFFSFFSDGYTRLCQRSRRLTASTVMAVAVGALTANYY